MRLLFPIALALAACSDPKPKRTGEGVDVGAYLPESPELVVRIDLERVRTWPKLPELADAALAPLAEVTKHVQAACGFDLLAETRTLLVARKGAWRAGDVTVVATGLTKLEACRAKLGTSGALAHDGTLYRIQLAGTPIASGKQIDDKLIIIQRAGKPIDAATFAQLAKRQVSPAWWSQLDHAAPIAARSETEPRIVTATIEPGDPLVARARLTSATAETVQRDGQLANAIAQYFKSAQAGDVRSETAGTSVKLDLQATGPEIDRLIDLVLPTLVGAPATAPPVSSAIPPGEPVTCAALDKAVEQYLMGSIKKAAEGVRADLEARTKPLLPLLRKVFVDSCTTGAWSEAAIRCHVETAAVAALSRFEKCREQLTPEQITPFDAATVAAMKAAAPK
jgi:hypothetical protein